MPDTQRPVLPGFDPFSQEFLADPAAVDGNRGTCLAGRPRTDREPSHFADACKSLAAEPQRADAIEILGRPQLACGVGRDRKRQLGRRDPAAVVDDPHECHTSLLEGHVDPRWPGIEGVFKQFLDDARRPLDHLAGGDPVDHRLGELLDPRPGRRVARLAHGRLYSLILR